jgi:hypothetical protein
MDCLRCQTVVLMVLPESNAQMTFYACPSCHRHFAQQPGRALHDRWLSPLSLVLYSVQFETDPQVHAHRVAQAFLRDRSRETIAAMIVAIAQELQQPTQDVRDILEMPQDEEALRTFLRLVVNDWKTVLSRG